MTATAFPEFTAALADVASAPGAGFLVPNQAALLLEPHRLVSVA